MKLIKKDYSASLIEAVETYPTLADFECAYDAYQQKRAAYRKFRVYHIGGCLSAFSEEKDAAIELYKEVKASLDKVSWYIPERREAYSINPWGYDATFYENLYLVGEVGAYFVARISDDYYKIPKREKGCPYKINRALRTNWDRPYSSNEMAQSRNNH